jgi:hypothetical protein
MRTKCLEHASLVGVVAPGLKLVVAPLVLPSAAACRDAQGMGWPHARPQPGAAAAVGPPAAPLAGYRREVFGETLDKSRPPGRRRRRRCPTGDRDSQRLVHRGAGDDVFGSIPQLCPGRGAPPWEAASKSRIASATRPKHGERLPDGRACCGSLAIRSAGSPIQGDRELTAGQRRPSHARCSDSRGRSCHGLVSVRAGCPFRTARRSRRSPRPARPPCPGTGRCSRRCKRSRSGHRPRK